MSKSRFACAYQGLLRIGVLGLLAWTPSKTSLAAPEIYPGVDPSPGAAPVMDEDNYTSEPISEPFPQSSDAPSAKSPRPAPADTVSTRRNGTRPSRDAGNGPRDAATAQEVSALRKEVARLKIALQRQREAGSTKTLAAQSEPRSYDPVPSDQAQAVARRLGIVARLILAHGRAYDYRTHTLRDLESILSSLEKVESGSPAPQGR